MVPGTLQLLALSGYISSSSIMWCSEYHTEATELPPTDIQSCRYHCLQRCCPFSSASLLASYWLPMCVYCSGLRIGSACNSYYTDILLRFETDCYSVAEGGEAKLCVALSSGFLPLDMVVTVSVERTEGATCKSLSISCTGNSISPYTEDNVLEDPEAFSLGLDLYYDENEYRYCLQCSTRRE